MLLMICLMLLIAIAIKIEVFKGLSTCVVFKTIVSIMKNSYVSSILCSILAVYHNFSHVTIKTAT